MTLSPFEWIGLAGALVLFTGPGYGLLSFYPGRYGFDKTQTVAVSIGLSIAAWSIGLAWLHALRIALAPAGVFAILSVGWAIGLLRARPWMRFGHTASDGQPVRDASRIALWAVLLLATAAGLWALRDVVAGPGSDAYHHTLITQLILDRGMLPDNYQPYAPLETFTYHFGFHGVAAAIAWLTGLKPIVIMPILAQVLAAASALSVAFFTQATTHSRSAATTSAIIAGLVSVFPAYFINWGRYTQLTGLVLLPIFLGLVWRWAESDMDWPLAPFLGALAGGIALAHYRVALMAASGVVVLLGVNGLMRKIGGSEWKRVVGRLIVAAAIAGALVAPWVVRLSSARQHGTPVDVGKPGATFFSLERLGPFVLNYPTNGVLIGVAAVALVVGWRRRERIVIAASIWAAVMVLLSTPRFAGAFMDTISVVISLYLPASAAIGWAIAAIVDRWAGRLWSLRWVARVGLAGLSLWGAVAIGWIVEPGAAYVGPDDLPAMDWIRANTPASARFMVNTFHWDFLPDYVIGSDAGYWLPLLAGRATVTAPMIYPGERSTSPEVFDRLSALDRLRGQLTSSEALALLRREGITHVYIGQRGGPISAAELEGSPYFKIVYNHNEVYVFEFMAVPGDG